MSDQPVVPSFLAEDLSKVDTSMPVLRGNLTEEIEIVSVAIERSKNVEEPIDMVVIKIKTLKPLPSTKNEVINEGFPLTTRIGITPLAARAAIGDKKERRERTQEMITKDVARFTQAVGVVSLMPLEQFPGKRAIVKFAVEPPSKDGKYGESNSFSFVKRG